MKLEEYNHINTQLGVSPIKFNIALTSVNSRGTLGELNLYVLRELGYDNSEIDLDVSNGFYYLNNNKNKPILFIVSVGEKEPPGITFQKNLARALDSYHFQLKSKNIWVPLMATGAGGLEFVDSYDTTIGVLKQFPEINFTISIPDDKKGKEFVKRFDVHNFVSNVGKAGKLKSTDTTTPNEPAIESITDLELKDLNETSPELEVSRPTDIPNPARNLKFTQSEFENNSNSKLDEIQDVINKLNGAFYLVGASWDNIDQTERFYKEQIWENGYDDKYKGLIQGIELGDILIMKSTYAQNNISYLKIKAVGVVVDNHMDGKSLSINWIIRSLNIDIAGLGHYRKTISSPKVEDVMQIFSKIKIVDLEELLEYTQSGNFELPRPNADKIPFHLDQVVDEDKLGREPVAKAFVRLIKKDIFTEKLNHSFMVHLQGKWGAGKSSFLNFIKKNLNADDENWIIVEYNAWQNQHITPPWWSLIDQVYIKSKEQLNWRACFHLWRKEVLRRIWRYSGWQKITAFFLFTLSLVCIFYFGEDIVNLFQETTQVIENGNDISKKSFASKLGDFGKLILTIASLLGTLYGFTKFITIPFFINSSKDAESFVLKASDPMNQVKRHFNDLVDNINNKDKKRQLAIFIDDIDRCDKDFIVQLLEGIQTLFKDKRVLYIVAGDKNWISTSFGNTYEEFTTNSVDKKQLGEFFIQKAFQLSFRLPNISEESKQNYWNHILGLKYQEEDKIESIDELTVAQQTEIKSVLKESKSELTNPEFVQSIQEKYNLSGDTASNIVIEEKNKDAEELKHLLQDYHKYIDTNPRSIIRLANNYTMARSILMAERVAFNEHVLFRWLVIEDLCPKVKTIVTSVEKMNEFEEIIKISNDIIKRNSCLKLLNADEDFMEGEITIEEIKNIKGL